MRDHIPLLAEFSCIVAHDGNEGMKKGERRRGREGLCSVQGVDTVARRAEKTGR